MVEVPAFCNKCGAAFGSGIVLENCRNISLSGNRSGPCPRCGSTGRVIDGVFNVVGDTIEILSAPQTTVESLRTLSAILKNAAAAKQTPDEIAGAINDKAPELNSISKYIPRNALELIGWLTLVILAIQTINELSKDDTPDINIILNQSIEKSTEPKNYYPFEPPKAPPARNAPCPCGGGKRYKHCCGKII